MNGSAVSAKKFLAPLRSLSPVEHKGRNVARNLWTAGQASNLEIIKVAAGLTDKTYPALSRPLDARTSQIVFVKHQDLPPELLAASHPGATIGFASFDLAPEEPTTHLTQGLAYAVVVSLTQGEGLVPVAELRTQISAFMASLVS